MFMLMTMSDSSQKPSSHHSLLVKIAQGLTKDDIEQLVFLSDTPNSEVEQISSAVSLFRSLERQKKLAPGRYFYLLSCLKDIGRYDLASLITQSESASYLPLCFNMPVQLLQLKFQAVQEKNKRYLQTKEMLTAACNESYWQHLCTRQCEFLTDVTDGGKPIFDKSEMETVARTVIQVIPQRMDVARSVFTAFQEHKSLCKAAQELRDGFKVGINAINSLYSIQAGKDLFRQLDAGIEERESDSYKCFQTVPLAAQRSLADLLLDLVGEKHIRSWSVETQQAIESISHSFTLCYPICWQVLSVLLAFQVHISFSSAELFIDEDFKSFITTQLPLYKESIKSNSVWITEVLQGTSLLKKIQQDGLVKASDQTFTPPLLQRVCPVAYASLITVILHYSDCITASDHLKLRKLSKELLLNRASEFSQMYSEIEKSFSVEVSRLLDKFRDDTLKEVLGTNSETNELIVHIFQH